MNPQELQNITEYIDRITADTAEGKITWAKTNPTTFVWKKLVGPNPVAQLSLQKIVQRRTMMSGVPVRPSIQIVENYVFQAVELPSGSLRLVINTEQDPNTLPLLKKLFDT